MMRKKIESHLLQKQSPFPTVCIFCNKTIPPNEIFYAEEGNTEHIHSLVARKFCSECYIKHGEQPLLTGLLAH